MRDRAMLDTPYRTASRFLEGISPRGRHFKAIRPEGVIFRGVGRISYRLTPSVFRPNSWVRIRGEWVQVRDLSARGVVFAEIEMIRDFCTRADRLGFVLPPNLYPLDQYFRRLRLQYAEERERGWPPNEIVPAIALAQHYGLPTRLLDWSRSAMVAAYFAALSAMPSIQSHLSIGAKPSPHTRLAVYGLEVYPLSELDWQLLEKEGCPLQVVTAPRAYNPNLHAQHGCFTLYRQTEEFPVWHARVEDGVSDLVRRFPHTRLRLVRFSLPASEAPMLLRLLAKEGVHGGTLFPSHEGVVRGIWEERAWGDQRPVGPLLAKLLLKPRVFALRRGNKPPNRRVR